MKDTISLMPIIDLEKYCSKGELRSVKIGYDGLLYVLIDTKEPDYIYLLYAFFEGQLVFDLEIKNVNYYINYVQPLSNDEILLLRGRACEWWPEEYQKNGRVYNKEGIFRRGIHLGDAIKDVQVTSKGVIWTSYFDEGYLGLVAWDSSGNQIYRFTPSDSLYPIIDCYALNVASDDDIWFYYYTEFPLVHLKSYKIKGVWEIPISGSRAFAVFGRYVVFQGGYNEHELYGLYKLSSKGISLVKNFTVLDGFDQELQAYPVAVKGDKLWLLGNNKIYSFTVSDVLK